jgi:hypothetical protein
MAFRTLALFLVCASALGQELTVTINNVPTKIVYTGALFGDQPWGHSVTAELSFQGNGCSEEGETNGVAVLIERGDSMSCTVVQKARNAQKNGGSVLIIFNSEDQELLTLKPDTSVTPVDQGEDITIPTILISKHDGDWIKGQLDQQEEVSVQVSWALPEEQKSLDVEWSVWAQTFDTEALRFKAEDFPQPDSVMQTLSAIATALDADAAKANSRKYYAAFRPRYFVKDGSSAALGCGAGGVSWNPLHPHCGRQCSNDGRYCTADPDGKSAQFII